MDGVWEKLGKVVTAHLDLVQYIRAPEPQKKCKREENNDPYV
jgi:hypothetical protein